MSDFSGIQVNRQTGGIGRRVPSTDGVFGLVMGGVPTGQYNELATVKKLIQLSDAEDLGFDAAYDANNGVQVYYHIKEFFTYNPNGTLYIMIIPQGTSMTEMLDYSNDYVKALILSETANREIKYVGVVLNPLPEYISTLSSGLDADVVSAIPKAQELVDKLSADNVWIDGVMIEGREANGNIADMYDLRSLAYRAVSVVIAQDYDQAALDVIYSKTAAVGAALGMLSVRKVSENLGSVDILNKPAAAKGTENYSLTKAASWITAALSSGVKVNTLTSVEKKALKDKGYIFAGYYEGYPNVYFNSSSTAIPLSDDFCFIERNRTFNKAARIAIRTLTPKINSNVEIDSNTGYIAASTVGQWESLVRTALNQMLADGEVSAIDFYIDPAQNVLAGAPVTGDISITPVGVAEAITVNIGFNNPFV